MDSAVLNYALAEPGRRGYEICKQVGADARDEGWEFLPVDDFHIQPAAAGALASGR
jgi:hypothetical protein